VRARASIARGEEHTRSRITKAKEWEEDEDDEDDDDVAYRTAAPRVDRTTRCPRRQLCVTDGHWHAMAACVLVAFDLVRLMHTVQGPTSWKPWRALDSKFVFVFFHVIGGWGKE
jgi:hypothetical protein